MKYILTLGLTWIFSALALIFLPSFLVGKILLTLLMIFITCINFLILCMSVRNGWGFHWHFMLVVQGIIVLVMVGLLTTIPIWSIFLVEYRIATSIILPFLIILETLFNYFQSGWEE